MSSIMATPAAKKAAEERRIDLAKVKGTGIGGYIQLFDVLSFKGVKVTPLAKSTAQYYDVDIEKVTPNNNMITKADVMRWQRNKQNNIIPVSGIRGVIARRMKESLATAPQYTNHSSVCVHELKKYMKTYTEKSLAENAIKPTFSDILIKAAAMAIRDNMIMNSSFNETYIEIHEHINIGLAVALDNGLIVPNIKNADRKSLSEITRERKSLVDKARAGKLLPEEYSGGTFTISNMGGYPVEYFTPIINLPESAILGVGTIVDKVVPIDGSIGIRPMLGLSLTCDHRHIDGAVSGAYLKRFTEILQNPICMEE